MNPGRLFLEQPEGEVRAAIQEEGSEQCFGCPHATLLAAQIVCYTNLQLRFVDTIKRPDHELYDDVEVKIRNFREQLRGLSAECEGFTKRPSRKSLNPSEMCDSPASPDAAISKFAGKVLDWINPAYWLT